MTRLTIERARTRTPVRVLTVLGILLVPAAIGGLLLAGLWTPADRLEQVTAAVVNEDEPVEIDGRTVPLGRQLTAGLVTGDSGTADAGDAASDSSDSGRAANVSGSDDPGNFTWVITDADDAAAGLAAGDYATVVTIPADFSAAATSYSEGADDAERATVGIATSDRSRLVDGAVSQLVTSTAISVLNEQLTATYLENIYVGFGDLGTRLGEAADGADELRGGATELGAGAGTLSSGLGELSGGAGELAGGIRELQGGASRLAGGSGDLGRGSRTLADGLGALSSGARQAGDGAQQAAGLAAQSAASSRTAAADVGILLAECAIAPTPSCATVQSLAATLGVTASGASPPEGSLLYLTGATAAATDGVAAGLTQPQGGQPSLVDGLAASAGGATSLADGAAGASAGAAELAGGAGELAVGADRIAAGAGQSATGAADLATGAGELSAGAGSLSEGLSEASASVPSYSTGDARALSDIVARPVGTDGAAPALFGEDSLPAFAAIALWLGALASFLVIAAVPARAVGAARSAVRLTLDAAAPGALIGAAQGLLLGGAMSVAVGLDPASVTGFVALSALAGVSFAAVNQGLVAAFGGIGRFASMLVAILGFAAAVVSTVPPWFAAVATIAPIEPALDALQAAVSGTASGLAGATTALVVWAAAGLLLTLAATARRRRLVSTA